MGSCAILCLVPPAAEGKGSLFAWRGEPLPTKSFRITEFGYSVRLAQSNAPRYGGNRDFHLQWEFGLMQNIKPKWALGLTAYYSADDEGSRYGVKLRGRRWLNRNTSIDFGAGPILRTLLSQIDHAPGLVAGVALNRSDLVSATLTLEMIPWKEPLFSGSYTGPPAYRKGTETTVYTGLRLGSYPGTIVGVVVPMTLLIDYIARVQD